MPRRGEGPEHLEGGAVEAQDQDAAARSPGQLGALADWLDMMGEASYIAPAPPTSCNPASDLEN